MWSKIVVTFWKSVQWFILGGHKIMNYCLLSEKKCSVYSQDWIQDLFSLDNSFLDFSTFDTLDSPTYVFAVTNIKEVFPSANI